VFVAGGQAGMWAVSKPYYSQSMQCLRPSERFFNAKCSSVSIIISEKLFYVTLC